MIVLGIDPGLASTGFGAVRCDKATPSIVKCGYIKTSAKEPVAKRLFQIYSDINQLIRSINPDLVAIENVFSLVRYPKAGILLGGVLGIIYLSVSQNNVSMIDQASYVADSATELGMARPLSELVRREPLCCPPGTPLGEALARMDGNKVGSIVTVDPEGRPVGIFTQRDVISRVILAAKPLSAPVSEVTTSPVLTLPGDATAADAALLMASRGIRHIVIEPEGRLAGVISERDLFSLQRLSLRQISGSIVGARDVAALAQLATDIRRLLRNRRTDRSI